MEPSDYCIIITTTETKENADAITQKLLHKNLAACIQSIQIESTYRWEGNVMTSKEIQLQIKTKASLFDEIKEQIRLLHTYDIPEIIMLPLLNANTAYLQWMEKEISGSSA